MLRSVSSAEASFQCALTSVSEDPPHHSFGGKGRNWPEDVALFTVTCAVVLVGGTLQGSARV